jgi:SAM-dependent methyltransferase
MSKFECWQTKEHATTYDARIYYPTVCLKKLYQDFNEFILLDKYLPKNESIKLLEVGCATGEIYRFLQHAYPEMEYIGCDISKFAIESGKKKYPNVNFMITDPELNEIKDVNPDYIFERDVVVHQTDPFAFLKQICLSAKKGVFFRLRTRDKGSTVLDVEKSCQMYHGLWAPYIMLNCDEVVSFLADLNICSKIVILKNYAILGGHHGRYLPKDCYLDETGTAESGVYIEIDQGSKRPEIIIEKKDENERIPFLYKFLKRVIQHSFGPKSSRVWW